MKSIFSAGWQRLIPLLIIGCYCLMIFATGTTILSPRNLDSPLQLMTLNNETSPIFYIDSQITYESQLVPSWIAEASTDSSQSLHLRFVLDPNQSDYSQLILDLQNLQEAFDPISLSVIGWDGISDTHYQQQLDKLITLLDMPPLAHIALIAYPSTSAKLSAYTDSRITGIGAILTGQEDLEGFQKLYHYFDTKKPLVIRDEIRASLSDDPDLAAREITASYYLLAINFPGVEMIFSPFIPSPVASSESYFITNGLPDFNLFYTIYSRLLEKPWLTTIPNGIRSSESPYTIISPTTELTGSAELILDPSATVLIKARKLGEKGQLYFKWNNEMLQINQSYPYTMTIDTTIQPQGLSRVSVVLENKPKQKLQTYSVDVTVEGQTPSGRAPRIPTATNYIESTTSTDYIPILMYHTIADTVLPEDENSHVQTEIFDAQLKALLDAGYTAINFLDLKYYAAGLCDLPDQPFIVTMDDGYLNNYTHAYPIYKKYDVQATLFVSPFYMKVENTERHFGWEAALEMESSGLIDIQPHGYDHTPLPYLSIDDMTYHASYATSLIEYYLGERDVNVLAYPQFRHNSKTVQCLSTLGYDFQMINLATDQTLINSAVDFNPPKLKRINVPNTLSPTDLVALLDELTQ